MKQIKIIGQAIKEDSERDGDIQRDLEDLLNVLARAYLFNWTAPTHDIVRRLMNEVHEFQPIKEKERW